MTRHETTTTQNDLWFLLFQLSLTARISFNKRFMAFVLQSMHMASYGVSACWSINRTSDSQSRTVEYQELKGAAAMARLLTESRSDWLTASPTDLVTHWRKGVLALLALLLPLFVVSQRCFFCVLTGYCEVNTRDSSVVWCGGKS